MIIGLEVSKHLVIETVPPERSKVGMPTRSEEDFAPIRRY